MTQSLPICELPLQFFEGFIGNFVFNGGFQNVRGHARIQGIMSCDHALASVDGVLPPGLVLEWAANPADATPVRRTVVVPQDPADPTSGRFVYVVDVRNVGKFVRWRWKSVSNLTNASIELYARPDNGGPPT